VNWSFGRENLARASEFFYLQFGCKGHVGNSKRVTLFQHAETELLQIIDVDDLNYDLQFNCDGYVGLNRVTVCEILKLNCLMINACL